MLNIVTASCKLRLVRVLSMHIVQVAREVMEIKCELCGHRSQSCVGSYAARDCARSATSSTLVHAGGDELNKPSEHEPMQTLQPNLHSAGFAVELAFVPSISMPSAFATQSSISKPTAISDQEQYPRVLGYAVCRRHSSGTEIATLLITGD